MSNESNRKRAIPFFRRSGLEILTRNQYVFMFLEDLRNTSSHYLHSIRFHVNGTSQATEYYRMLLSNPSQTESGKAFRDDSEVLRDFIEEVLESIFLNGEAVIQMVRSETEPGKIIELHSFTPEHLIRVPFYYCQIVPRDSTEIYKRRFTWINAQDIWKISMPAKLGGMRGHRLLVRRMAAVNRLSIFLSNLTVDKDRGEFLSIYDFKHRDKIERIYLTKLLINWAWNCRDTSLENQTEYFLVYQYVKFRLAVVSLLVQTIQQIVATLDKICATETRLDGLQNPDYIADILHRMQSNEVPLTKAIEDADRGFPSQISQPAAEAGSQYDDNAEDDEDTTEEADNDGDNGKG